MGGLWYAPVSFACGGFALEIKENNEGRLFGFDNSYCSSTELNIEGKVKFKGDVLYIKNRKYTIIEEPQLTNNTDSIDAPDENNFSEPYYKKRKILAKMTLKEKGAFAGKTKYTFYKYLNY